MKLPTLSTLNQDQLRMAHWLLFSLLAYTVASLLKAAGHDVDGLLPRVQTVLWKCGHLNLAAFLGYWIDRHAYRDRVTDESPAHVHIRRAIIMGFAMVAFSIAL